MISGSILGADHKKSSQILCTGYDRPMSGYGITGWGIGANTNFQKISVVQNQGFRIITESLKLAPISKMESGLENRRDITILNLDSKAKYIPDHPLKNCIVFILSILSLHQKKCLAQSFLSFFSSFMILLLLYLTPTCH